MSRPIVVTACMSGSSESWGPQQHPHPWHCCAGGGAVHSIKSRQSLFHPGRKAKPPVATVGRATGAGFGPDASNISGAKIRYLGRYVDQPPIPHAASIKPL